MRKTAHFLSIPWEANRESASPNLDTLLHQSKQNTSSRVDLDSEGHCVQDSGHWKFSFTYK